MISDIVKVSDARVQALGLKFVFITEAQKLIIEATSSKQNIQYVGQIMAHPYIDFQDIKEMLQEGQFKTISKTDDLLKIKVGATPIQMVCKSKSQIKALQEKIQKSLEKQAQLQKTINLQNEKINQLSLSLSDIKATIQQLKLSPKSSQISAVSIDELKHDFTMRLQDLRRQFKCQISEMKSPNLDALQKKIKTTHCFVRQSYDNQNIINDDLQIQIRDVKNNLTQQFQAIKNRVQQNTKIINQILTQNEQNILKSEKLANRSGISVNQQENESKIEVMYLILNQQCRKVGQIQDKIQIIQLKQFQQSENKNLEKQKILIEQKSEMKKQESFQTQRFKLNQKLRTDSIKVEGNVITKKT